LWQVDIDPVASEATTSSESPERDTLLVSVVVVVVCGAR
jgi:hypothetical protein